MVINDLKRPCPQCRGSGRQPGITEWGIARANPGGACHACAGRGFQLTELGQEVLKLLRPFVEEWIDARRPPPAPEPKPDEDEPA